MAEIRVSPLFKTVHTQAQLQAALRGKVAAINVENALWVRISHREAWRIVKALRDTHDLRVEHEPDYLDDVAFLDWDKKNR